MKKLIFILSLVVLAGSCSVATDEGDGPVKVIVETDMGNDIDDALALALAYKAMDEGKMEVLAVGCHKLSQTPGRYVDILNTYYGHPEIEVAMSATPVEEYSDYTDYTAAPCEMGFAESRAGQFREPVELYREILSKVEDNSITFISLGFGTTLAQLLDSQPDEHSPLTGRELVGRKVKTLSIMAGSYGEKKRAEYNVINDIPAMKKVFAEWPGTIVQNPFEIGKQVVFPHEAIDANLGYEGLNPVVEGYKLYQKMPYNRPSWDILSVIWLTAPELFTVSEPGTITVDDEGYTWFTPSAEGRHFVLSATLDQPQALKEYMINMLMK